MEIIIFALVAIVAFKIVLFISGWHHWKIEQELRAYEKFKAEESRSKKLSQIQ